MMLLGLTCILHPRTWLLNPDQRRSMRTSSCALLGNDRRRYQSVPEKEKECAGNYSDIFMGVEKADGKRCDA